MNRFEKKCFIGSATFHGLLLVVFLFSSAFLSSKTPTDMGPVITMENIRLTDGRTTGGGNPNAVPTPPTPPPPTQPAPETPLPPPTRVEPRVETPKPPPVKVKDVPVKPIETERGDLPVPVAKPKKETQPTKSVLTSKPIKKNDEALMAEQRAAAEKAAKEADRRRREEVARVNAERQRLANTVNDILGDTKSGLTKGTVVDTAGPGGEAFVNYGSFVGEAYKRAVYATQPQSDGDAEATIKVLIARSGAVLHSQWVRRTGNSVLDKAVDRAMNSVRSLPAFPPGAKDSERSFNIRIAFEAKKISA